jgi:alpha-L-rhamnosidase
MKFSIQNMKYCWWLFLLLPVLNGCNGSGKDENDHQKNVLRNAGWITDLRKTPDSDSLMYGDFPAPMFRKEFMVDGDISSATLYITAAGYYHATVNGNPLKDNILNPAWTNFSKRIYYRGYDLTSELKKGKNCLGTVTGNGFYNPLPMKFWSSINLRDYLPTGKPCFIARLNIKYTDGRSVEIKTDRSWKYAYGPVVRNNVYLGEVYDASGEIPGWDRPGFDDSGWQNAVQEAGPGGELEKAFFPPVRITGIVHPSSVQRISEKTCIADMGVNFTGLYRIKLRGDPGDTVTFRFGERLYDDGTLNPMTSVAGQIKRTRIKGNGNDPATWNSEEFNTDNGPGCPNVAWQTDSYVFGSNREITYIPEFTFHIYRYMEINGLAYLPDTSDIRGISFNSYVENSNSFSCSSHLINSIQEATRRTFQDNLISVQSDCPGRERFGYGGDLNATCDAFICNFDMHEFYRKTIYDWVDAMQDSIFIDTAPYVGIKICGLSWESAFLLTQNKLLLYYNDTGIVRELYQKDLKWMEKAARLHPSGVVDKGLSDHESLVKVPVKLIGTSHYLECARVMDRFATIMNDTAGMKKFGKLASDLKDKIRMMYWSKPVPDTINRQTLFATLLYYDIVPESEKKAASDSLIKALQSGPAGHFTTGIFGTKYILETLSASGNEEKVFNVVNSRTSPGWGYMIDRGATSIWETWKESDNVYSNCHPMFGSVSEWFYRWLAGIRPDADHPGFSRFFVSPFLPADLSYVKCTYVTPNGLIRSDWEKEGKTVRFRISVPKNSIAVFTFPDRTKTFAIIENTENNTSWKKNLKDTGFTMEMNHGDYLISY